MERGEDNSRQRYARLAGLLLLFTNATAIFAFSVRGPLIVKGDAPQTAANIAASETLFRMGIAGELVTVAGVVALVAALYVVLSPFGRGLALIAALWRLMENALLAAVTFASFTALALLNSAGPMQSGADAPPLQTLVYTLVRVHSTDGFQLGFLFLGLGQALFSYLWWKSRYIPRWLAGLGIFASSVMALVSLSYIVWPGILSVVTLAYMAPMGIYEIGLGAWLLVKGIKLPVVERDLARETGRAM